MISTFSNLDISVLPADILLNIILIENYFPGFTILFTFMVMK